MSGTRRFHLLAQTTAVCAALLLPAVFATTTSAAPVASTETTTHLGHGKNTAMTDEGSVTQGKTKKNGKTKSQKGTSDADGANLGEALNTLKGALGAGGNSTGTDGNSTAPGNPDQPMPKLDDQQLSDLGKSLGSFASGFMASFQAPPRPAE
ncbi:hypothetical protein [Nocardia sp. NPDC051570]|uniref:hypothetical protein n=1 Tax=Nocardia sp. NPDC051570 TaxID=3364324 RepID=UPI0037B5084F